MQYIQFAVSSSDSKIDPEVIMNGLRIVDNLHWIMIIGGVLAAYPIRYMMKRYREKNPLESGSQDILLGELSQGVINSTPYLKTPDGHDYQIVTGVTQLTFTKGTANVCSIDLPFMSSSHLVGIPLDQIASLDFAVGSLERVHLEGDYNDYFQVYVARGGQVDARYVLDPKAMVFTIDFCKKFSWEISGSTMYVLSEGATINYALIDQFIREIKPAIAIGPPSQKSAAELPMTHQTARTVPCPRCQKDMEKLDYWFECAEGHGVLIAGSELVHLRENEEALRSVLSSMQVIESTALTPVQECPQCHSTMKSTQYGFTQTMIDVCEKCPYRWFDSGELRKVFEKNTKSYTSQ